MDSEFINKVCSYYSLLESCVSIDDLIAISKLNKNKYILLVDKNMCSCIEFYFKCQQNELIPIIGLEINYLDNNLILIAKNNHGYCNLLKISSFDKTNVDFQLQDYCQDLIVILRKGNLKINNGDFYLISELAINDVYYLKPEDIKTYKALICIKNEINYHDCKVKTNNYFLSSEEALKRFDKKLIDKTFKLLSQCQWKLNNNNFKLAQFTIPKNISSEDFLKKLCIQGLQKKLNLSDGFISKKYADRLAYELEVINRMKFNDYFLIVQDFVQYAKQHKIMIGPGRGSAAGSLVAFALDITTIDPIVNNLYFERFLNPERTSLPDIDIDVMDTKRQMLIDYIFNKYQLNNTCYIATFQRIKAKMAIRDVGRILGIELKTIDKISKLISLEFDNNLMQAIENNQDLQVFYKQYPDLFDIAHSLINIPRQVSTHAAGIIISNEAIYEDIAIQKGIDDWNLSQISMEYIEKLGLIKIDILGLKNLSIIATILEMIKNNHHQEIDLNKIDLNDQNLFNEITRANTIGIFQLESNGMRNTLKKVKVNSIEDISIVSALFRPGPQAIINNYVKTKNGELEPHYVNKQIKPILEPTLGFCIYQEQVIELIKSVAGFSTGQADILRRAISKKKEQLIIKTKNSFLSGALKNGYTNEQALEVFNYLLEFANYGFNHSHSLAYAYISYQMMFLKYYYPLEFHLSLLKFGDNSFDKINSYIFEAKRFGIKIYNVSILDSEINFSVYQKGIIFGLSNIKGIGYEIAKKIIVTRLETKFDDYVSAIVNLSSNINKKTIEILIKVGAFDIFNVDRLFLLNNLDEIIENGSFKNDNADFLFGLNLKEEDLKMDELTRSNYEYQYLGFCFSNNAWAQHFESNSQKFNLQDFDLKTITNDKNYLIYINSIRKANTKFGNPMLFIKCSIDMTNYDLACFDADLIKKIKPNQYLIVNFSVDKKNKNNLKLANIIETL